MQMQNRLLKMWIFLLCSAVVVVCTFDNSRVSANSTKLHNRNAVASDRDGNGCDGDFEFRGMIQALPNTAGFIGDWMVSGRTVHVSANTEIEREGGQVAVGAYAEVEGCLQTDGSVIAKEIEVKSSPGGGMNSEFTGTVEELPTTTDRLGDWKVSGVVVHVTAMTLINQAKMMVAVGVRVEVEGSRRQDGSVDAFKIEVKSEMDVDQHEFRGTIESLPDTPGRIGQWSVSGRKVNVTANTRIKPDAMSVAIGNVVEVEGSMAQDGSINATEIEVKFKNGMGNFAEFDGTVEMLPGTPGQIGVWTVSGRKVNVDANTKIVTKGQSPAASLVAVGSRVKVKGSLQTDGSVNAARIKVKIRDEFEFSGKIESLPATSDLVGDWRVAGRTVHVTAMTEIERKYSMVAVGAFVEVEGMLQADGSVLAREIEVKQGSAGGAYMNFNAVTTVSAASYKDDNAPEGIVAGFGVKMSPSTALAGQLPLPTSLANVSVLVDGRQARLFVVTSGQINYQLPSGTPKGTASVLITNNGQVIAQGTVDVSSVAPSMFTANATGEGPPAGAVLRITATGKQVYEAVARFDASLGKLVPVPIVRRPGEQLFLIMYGTGMKQAPNTDGNSSNGVAESVSVTIGGVNAQVAFAGSAPGFAGLEQMNVRIPDNAPSGATVTVVVKVRDVLNIQKQANGVTMALQ